MIVICYIDNFANMLFYVGRLNSTKKKYIDLNILHSSLRRIYLVFGISRFGLLFLLLLFYGRDQLRDYLQYIPNKTIISNLKIGSCKKSPTAVPQKLEPGDLCL